MFNGRTIITGGNYAQVSASIANITQNCSSVNARESEAFKTLIANVAPAALYDSGEIPDPPKCHPGTRVDVITVLITWAMTAIYTLPIRWLNGPAGAGKSAIMRTLAERLVEKGLLLASFFFFRSDGDRNSAKLLISTIAYQLCLSIPPLQPHIERAIESNPLIFRASLSTQTQRLIVDPFLRYFYDPNSIMIAPFPRIILIDGLDECQGHETQSEILTTLCRMLRTLPIPLAIVVASRPEHQIRIAFELDDLCQASSRVTLDDSFHPDKDIRTFYHAEFAKIRKTHPMRSKLEQAWPAEAVITKLVVNASGQFIYAATIIRFIKSIRHHPATRLQIVLGNADRGTSKPFQQLDLLYTVIFQNVDPDVLPDTLRVLGIVFSPLSDIDSRICVKRNDNIMIEHPLFRSPDFIDSLLDLPPGHARSVLSDLESLLTVTNDKESIKIFHTSLEDFLFDKSRAADIFIDRGLVYTDIAHACIQSLDINIDERHYSEVGIRLTLQAFRADFIDARIGVSLQNATPTDHLRRSIAGLDFDMKIPVGYRFSRVYGAWVPAFLAGLRQSHFPDAEELYHSKIASLGDILNPILKDHWFRDARYGYTFQSVFLMVLVVALSGANSRDALHFLHDISVAHIKDVIFLFPGIEYGGGAHCTANMIVYDENVFLPLLLDIIDSPNDLLHQPRGKAECTALIVHLLHQISSKGYIIKADPNFIHSQKDFMEYVLPFLLNTSSVRADLTTEAKRIESDKSGDGAYLQSDEIAGAIDQYLERASDFTGDSRGRPRQRRV